MYRQFYLAEKHQDNENNLAHLLYKVIVVHSAEGNSITKARRRQSNGKFTGHISKVVEDNINWDPSKVVYCLGKQINDEESGLSGIISRVVV